MNYKEVIDEIIRVEGDAYTNDPKDNGGPTKYGITLKTLSEYRGKPCTAEDVQNLQRQEAFDIYFTRYVKKPKFDLIAEHSSLIAGELVDTGVNMGPGTATKFLQRALNALNNEGKLYPEIAVDGGIGPGTANALKAYLAARGKTGEKVLHVLLNALQGVRYLELAEANKTQERFLYGWLHHRVEAQLS